MSSETNPEIRGHILSFRNNQFKQKGIRCNPPRIYGVSKQSPKHFSGNHTLTLRQSFIYQETPSPSLSQRKYIDIGYGSQGGTFEKDHKYCRKDVQSFRKRKGLLSQFMDKNKIMLSVTPVVGIQRNFNRIKQTIKKMQEQRYNRLSIDGKIDLTQNSNSNMFVIKSKMRSIRKNMALQKSQKTQKYQSARSTFYQGFNSSKKSKLMDYY